MSEAKGSTTRPWRMLFAGLDLLASGGTAWGVFHALPARFLPIDLGGVTVALALAASGVALIVGTRSAERVARASAWVVLALGMLAFALLVATAGWLAGVYGPVGKGGAALFGAVAALVLPYLVALPAAQLAWLGGRRAP